MSIFSFLIRKKVKEQLPKAVEKVLKERLPAVITEILREKFKENPSAPLSAAGFNWAFYLALREHWPDVDGKTAIHCLRDYVDVPHGTEGYDWTAAAAKELADDYAREFGE